MRIVIFSTNTNKFKKEDFQIEEFLSSIINYNKCIKKYTSLEIILTYQLPGTFLIGRNQPNSENSENKIIKHLELKGKSAGEIAEEILNLKPDIAIQATFWTEPFDWLPLQDCLIGEILSSHGIKTICHPLESALICFNKRRSRDFFLENRFPAAKSVYVHHELFRTERSHQEILNNPYQEIIFEKIKKLNFPVIIKDTFGLSSYGMDVVSTFPMAKNILMSKKNSGDRLVEEFLDGQQFGTEIHGTPGNYTVFPPFLFSTNQYGITSPKQSVKIGPVLNEKFNLPEFYRTMSRLAEKLNLCGTAQVDLVFHNKKWHVLEVNPRLSGLTPAISCACGKTIEELLLDVAFSQNEKNPSLKYVIDLKFPVLATEMLKKLSDFDSVLFVRQMLNKKARQHREEGFCEVIFGGCDSLPELEKNLDRIQENFHEIIEPEFFNKAHKMLMELNSPD